MSPRCLERIGVTKVIRLDFVSHKYTYMIENSSSAHIGTTLVRTFSPFTSSCYLFETPCDSGTTRSQSSSTCSSRYGLDSSPRVRSAQYWNSIVFVVCWAGGNVEVHSRRAETALVLSVLQLELKIRYAFLSSDQEYSLALLIFATAKAMQWASASQLWQCTRKGHCPTTPRVLVASSDRAPTCPPSLSTSNKRALKCQHSRNHNPQALPSHSIGDIVSLQG